MLDPVRKALRGGADGSFRASISSSSSSDGKAWLNSDKLGRLAILGDDDVDDVGEGGPKLEAGMRVWTAGDVELLGTGDTWLEEGTRGEVSVCRGVRRGLEKSGESGWDVEDMGVDGIDVEDAEGIDELDGEGNEGR